MAVYQNGTELLFTIYLNYFWLLTSEFWLLKSDFVRSFEVRTILFCVFVRSYAFTVFSTPVRTPSSNIHTCRCVRWLSPLSLSLALSLCVLLTTSRATLPLSMKLSSICLPQICALQRWKCNWILQYECLDSDFLVFIMLLAVCCRKRAVNARTSVIYLSARLMSPTSATTTEDRQIHKEFNSRIFGYSITSKINAIKVC